MGSLTNILLLFIFIFFFLVYFFRTALIYRLKYVNRKLIVYFLFFLISFFIGVFYSSHWVIPMARNYCKPVIKSHVIRENTPEIASAEPLVAYPSTIIVVTGKHFGWLQIKEDSKNRIVLDNSPLETHFWSDQKIYVRIPLEITTGKHYLSIQSTVRYNGHLFKVSSNKVELQVISRTDGWDWLDDLYFQELDRMNSEDRKLIN